MSSGADFDYGENRRKANWRRTIHNRIAERLTCKPKDAVALYLAGRQDLDRDEFLRRGFTRDNLIAIDRDGLVVNQLRSNGVLAIRGDAVEVLNNWKPNVRIDVVYFDFCCGITEQMRLLAVYLVSFPFLSSVVVALNFLRGRDKAGKSLLCELQSTSSTSDPRYKHRGFLFMMMIENVLAKGFRAYPELFPITSQQCHKAMRLWYGSYYSPKAFQHFDSVVFVNAYHDAYKTSPNFFQSVWDPQGHSKMRSQVSAIKAIRTQRIGA